MTNPAAESARENARRPDGRFGTFSLAEAIDVDLDLDEDLDEDMEPDEYADAYDIPDGDLVGEAFQVPGSSSIWEVRATETDHDRYPLDHDLYRDGVNVGEIYCAVGAPDDEVLAEARHRAVEMLGDAARPATTTEAFARITNPEWREACEQYATRYAAGPDVVGFEPDWDRAEQVSARHLQVGQRLHPTQRALPEYQQAVHGSVITRIDSSRAGVVAIYCDGTNERPSALLNHGDPVTVHADRVDLSDPDWFEAEAARVLSERITAHAYTGGGVLGDDTIEQMNRHVRYGLYRSFSTTDISPLHPDGPRYDKRIANGRAKVGDDVMTDSPMYGSTSYRVLGKKPARVILGADDDGVQWGENGEVEYILEQTTTGHQTTSNLRGHTWKRVPAPGDTGPGAQAQRLDR
ncbi:hypothetical protein [Nocardioides sp. Leaf285]|uniref:hypothetical protein n=1 Tax=Nocardioides sp. Leaf285 TaxID=1736322 RepID=UPI000702ECCA|nr:hypothetical protein [Nocardioides sp. Leaf285]KQP62883.1 hypothetical protein ASF47_17885 [Nocardioides sp. Leaf285]